MRTFTPRTAHTIGMRTMVAAGPLALAMIVAWALRLEFLGLAARPTLALMLYMLFLLLTVGGFCVALLASCHMAIAKAFGHGVQVGTDHAHSTPVLRVVE